MENEHLAILMALCLWFSSPPEAAADSYRCGRTVVRDGDPVLKLLTACGEPRLRAEGVGMIRVDGERKKIPIQCWYYKTGNRSLEHVVVIHGERIAAIEVGGRRPVRAGVRVPP